MILVGHRREIPAMSCCASQPAPLTCLASRDSPLDTEQYRQQLQSCPDNHPVVSTPISDCGTVILQSIIPAVPAAAHAEHHSILSGQNPVRQAAILGSPGPNGKLYLPGNLGPAKPLPALVFASRLFASDENAQTTNLSVYIQVSSCFPM